MKKIKVTPELIEKAKKAFAASKSRYTKRSELGLTRAEIRALERKGLIDNMGVFGERKYSSSAPAMHYVWRWKGE